MKQLMILVALFAIVGTSYANEVYITKGDTMLTQAEAEVVSVEKICPQIPGQISCKAYGSIVKVKVSLHGCLDRMGGYFSTFDVIDGKGVLTFGAINISNAGSKATMCLIMPAHYIDIPVAYEGEVELQNMIFNAPSFE